MVMKAEVLSYSLSKGLFAGISLEGSTLRSDGSANEKLYGQKLTAKEIIRDGKVKAPPPSASELVALLRSQVAGITYITTSIMRELSQAQGSHGSAWTPFGREFSDRLARSIGSAVGPKEDGAAADEPRTSPITSA